MNRKAMNKKTVVAFTSIAILVLMQVVQTLLKLMNLYHFSAICLIVSGVVAMLTGWALQVRPWVTILTSLIGIVFGILKLFIVWN